MWVVKYKEVCIHMAQQNYGEIGLLIMHEVCYKTYWNKFECVHGVQWFKPWSSLCIKYWLQSTSDFTETGNFLYGPYLMNVEISIGIKVAT